MATGEGAHLVDFRIWADTEADIASSAIPLSNPSANGLQPHGEVAAEAHAAAPGTTIGRPAVPTGLKPTAYLFCVLEEKAHDANSLAEISPAVEYLQEAFDRYAILAGTLLLRSHYPYTCGSPAGTIGVDMSIGNLHAWPFSQS